MELQELWKKLETEKLEVVKVTSLTDWPPKSKHPVRKLEQSFFYTLLFVLFFEGCFTYLFLHFTHPFVRTFLGLVVLSYLFFFFVNLRVYRGIRKEIDFSNDLYHTLKSIYNTVDLSMRFQRKAAIFIYPIAASAGFLLGFSTKKDPSIVVQETRLLLIMIGVSIVLTPIGYYLARWLEKHSYGKYCEQLKELIRQLEVGRKEN